MKWFFFDQVFNISYPKGSGFRRKSRFILKTPSKGNCLPQTRSRNEMFSSQLMSRGTNYFPGTKQNLVWEIESRYVLISSRQVNRLRAGRDAFPFLTRWHLTVCVDREKSSESKSTEATWEILHNSKVQIEPQVCKPPKLEHFLTWKPYWVLELPKFLEQDYLDRSLCLSIFRWYNPLLSLRIIWVESDASKISHAITL